MKLANELDEAMRTSFGATFYMFLTLNTGVRDEGMETSHSAEQRQQEAIAFAERLPERIRRY
jgi:hypothetical protein